jgi:hypothetical protein
MLFFCIQKKITTFALFYKSIRKEKLLCKQQQTNQVEIQALPHTRQSNQNACQK